MKYFISIFFTIPVFVIFQWSCTPRTISLYDQQNKSDTLAHIENFYAVGIFKDYVTSEVWQTEDTSCLIIQNIFGNKMIGDGGLYVKWNKTSGGCNWIGMGIGWDGWTGKNLQDIYKSAAIQFKVRSPKGIQKGLPWAMALEDYGGGQAWAGVFSNYIEGQQITENWTTVQVPLEAFDFNQFDADITSVKQLIIQFESAGEIYLDELEIVPLAENHSKSIELPLIKNVAVVDGEFDSSIYLAAPLELENGKAWIAITDKTLSLFVVVDDLTPLQNKNTNAEIWNGDAFEIAFATNPDAPSTRKLMLLSDQHLGIRATKDPFIWNWRTQSVASGTVITKPTDKGYLIEATIPLAQFIASPFISGNTYGIEIAIDEGTLEKGRITQYRWNNPYNEGFHISPQLWGQFTISEQIIRK